MNAHSRRTPKQEIPRVSRRRGSSVVGLFTRHHRIANAHTLLLQAIEQAPRPDELCRQDAERKHDGEPARPRSRNHHDSERQQREPYQHFDVPLRLLERMDQHRRSRFTRITRARGRLIGRPAVRCGSTNYVSACTRISIVTASRVRHFQIRAREAVALHQPSARAAAFRAKRLPQMERFCRESGNTGSNACASQSKILQPACAESDGSASIRICTRYPRKLSG
jgi:hypothetical protein